MITLFVRRESGKRVRNFSLVLCLTGKPNIHLLVLLTFCSCLHCDVSRLINEIKCRLVRINLVQPLQCWSQNENKLFLGNKILCEITDITDTHGLNCIGKQHAACKSKVQACKIYKKC